MDYETFFLLPKDFPLMDVAELVEMRHPPDGE